MTEPHQRRRIRITGAVQGVGFRPFIYRLAVRFGVAGFVRNTAGGVEIEAQGAPGRLDTFLAAITAEGPPLAHPKIVSAEIIAVLDSETGFTIETSSGDQQKMLTIAADTATCEDCLRELADPANRRYCYPFINCTNCGPRYTIIHDVPYDRPNTTMADFTMCPDCEREYSDPADRRFHAQPNACPVCGPHVWLTDRAGKTIETDDPVGETVRFLESGSIVAVKGLGGFHLAVRGDDFDAVERLRQRKFRKVKAFAIMCRDVESARKCAEVDAVREQLLVSPQRPITLCPKRPGSPIARNVAPSSHDFGIMLPYTPLHTLLIDGSYPALVMTSGNNSDDPIVADNVEALESLHEIADYFLLHNRDIYTRCDDSVIKVSKRGPVLIRRARGYVPEPIPVHRRSGQDILAVGAAMKNTITLFRGERAYVSQHIGDLQNESTYDNFVRTAEKLIALTGAQPGVIACDLHPAMLSTRFAETFTDIPLIRVQHHHAHIAAVMAEHDLEGPVVGLTLDGTGYGTDGTIWGGELLSVWRDRFERRGRLRTLVLPGGDAAARQSWRMALSALIDTFGAEEGRRFGDVFLSSIPADQRNTIAEMIEKKINCPETSSLGRLFDAVSALLGVCLENTCEAQAAMTLEYIAKTGESSGYPVRIEAENGLAIISIRPVIEEIVSDLQSGISPGVVGARFHNTIIHALTEWSVRLCGALKTSVVAMAGGVFQNSLILDGLIERLKQNDIDFYINHRLPPNDGSISFGQAVVADAICSTYF